MDNRISLPCCPCFKNTVRINGRLISYNGSLKVKSGVHVIITNVDDVEASVIVSTVDFEIVLNRQYSHAYTRHIDLDVHVFDSPRHPDGVLGATMSECSRAKHPADMTPAELMAAFAVKK